jgi:hypothetical protein
MSQLEHDIAEAEPELDAADEAALKKAVDVLEHPSLPGRLSVILGRQIDMAEQIIPEPLMRAANGAAGAALRAALRAAMATLPKSGKASAPRFHTALAAISGAAGGAFGLATLPVELPVSTTIILRSIAEIARDAGEDLQNPEAVLACLEVFALGGGAKAGPASNSGYLAVRAMLSKSVQQATRVVLQRGYADESAPALVRFIGQIVSRFGVVVSQKLMAQAVPVVGAVAGAAINAAFTEHYQGLARAHFTVRRLERRYGAEVVRRAYQRILRTQGEPRPTDATALLPAS